MTDTALKVSRSLYFLTLTYLMVLKTISPSCGVRASLMLFFSLLISAVILLLNCLVLILYFYIHFLSLRCYFVYLNIILDHLSPLLQDQAVYILKTLYPLYYFT